MKLLLAVLSLAPALFAPQTGWHTGHDRVRACQGVSAARCVQAASWAATIRWRGCGDCVPNQMIAGLPRDGIILQVDVAVEHPLRDRRELAWPPTIRAGDVGGLEGVPRRYGVWQLFARFGRVEAYAWAFFGSAHPSPSQLAAANAELKSTRLTP